MISHALPQHSITNDYTDLALKIKKEDRRRHDGGWSQCRGGASWKVKRWSIGDVARAAERFKGALSWKPGMGRVSQ